ncbi:MAG: hypothetical protein AB1505_09075 [Candidatus Latescibacterota bacterium]
MPPGTYRLPVSLSEREILFLEALGLEAKRSGGRRLAKAAVVRALIAAVRELHIDVNGVRTEAELGRRMRAAMGTEERG